MNIQPNDNRMINNMPIMNQNSENIILKGRITNTPDVVESVHIKSNPSVYLNKDGKAYKIDENGDEVKNDMSFVDKVLGNAKKIKFNVDSWLNKPSSDMGKIKADIGLNILTAPFGIGKFATSELAAK